MKRVAIGLLWLVILGSWATPSLAARAGYTFFNPPGSFAIEVSLENPPHDLTRLPIYQNAITSLAVVGDHIVGGTSARPGLGPFVFVASLSERKLTHKLALDQVIAGQRSIRSGFCRGKDNALYAGTIPNEGRDASGHLIKVNVSSDGAIHVKDLGVPLPDQGIFSLTCNPAKGEIYGISYPSGFFFRYDIRAGKAHVYRDTVPSEKALRIYHEFALEPADYLSADLIVDDSGRVYGSEPINRLFYYDPQTDRIHVLKDRLPFVWGRHVLGRVDAWARAKDGTLYGGNAGDGQLFRLDPATGKVVNLGKPIMMNRMPALAFAGDSLLYGIAGAAPGYAHLFYYDAGGRGFYDLGNPQFRMVAPGIEQGIAWRGFQIATLTASPDGKYIVMGENESLSQLLVFPVSGGD